MSEELLHEETMADYEEHFDDANPWNLVTRYMEKGTVLPVKIEGIVNGGAIAMVVSVDLSQLQDFPFPISKTWKHIFPKISK